MQKQKRLMYGMAALFLIVFVTFGVIIVNEKLAPLKINKITTKIEEYLKENYKDIEKEVELQKVKYETMKYIAKVQSKDNKHLYFNIYYENKKITDTYKEDYLEGKTILSYRENQIKKNIKDKTKFSYKVSINQTLDKFTDNIKKEIITNDHLEQLEVYSLEADITVKELTSKRISSAVKNFVNNLNNNKINPKNFTLTVTSTSNKVNAIKISNITTDLVKSTNLNLVIDDIINKEKSNLLNKYDIEYEYLN